MKPIPSYFELERYRPIATAKINPACEWVMRGEGLAYRMRDGWPVLLGRWKGPDAPEIDLDAAPVLPLYAFRLHKITKPRRGESVLVPVHHFMEYEDEYMWQMWVPCMPTPGEPMAVEDRLVLAAFNNLAESQRVPGATYELCGPGINGNREHLPFQVLFQHYADPLPAVPRDYRLLRDWLNKSGVRGIVWRHPDGRTAKATRREFGLSWPVR